MNSDAEINERGRSGPRKVIEQEARVQCIWCGHDTEPNALAVREHVESCSKHPTGIALRFLRLIQKGDGNPKELASHALFCMTGGREGCVNARFLVE